MSKNLNFKLGYNWPFPSSPWPLYQNEFKCSAFDTEMIFHFHNFHKKGCALGLIFHLRLLPKFLEFSGQWFAFRKFNRFRNFWKLYYSLLFPNFRKFWSNGKRTLSPISIQGRAIIPDVDGFLYSSFKPLRIYSQYLSLLQVYHVSRVTNVNVAGHLGCGRTGFPVFRESCLQRSFSFLNILTRLQLTSKAF